MRRSTLSIIPGGIAAAALAPVVATYFGVQMIIRALQGLATNMGGLAAISAGLCEAMQPIVFASWLACGLLVICVILAIRVVIDDDEQPISTSLTTVALLLSLIALALAPFGLRSVSGIIVDVMDPHIAHSSGIAETSQRIASRLRILEAGAVVMAAALLGFIAAICIVQPKQRASAAIGRVLVFVAILALAAAVVNTVVYRSWSATLYHIAVTGERG